MPQQQLQAFRWEEEWRGTLTWLVAGVDISTCSDLKGIQCKLLQSRGNELRGRTASGGQKHADR